LRTSARLSSGLSVRSRRAIRLNTLSKSMGEGGGVNPWYVCECERVNEKERESGSKFMAEIGNQRFEFVDCVGWQLPDCSWISGSALR
jgi:hypothetical protein